MSTRTTSLCISQSINDEMVEEHSKETAHIIDHRILPPSCKELIEPEVRGKLVYIISGLGEILSEEDQKLRSFTRGKVYYLPYNQLYKIRNSGSDTLKYLVVAQEEPDPREVECGLESPCLLFRYFREGEEHYEDGGIFIRNEMHPDDSPLQLPVVLSDLSVEEEKESKWNVADRNICHIILEGNAMVSFESGEPAYLKEGEQLTISKGTVWQINNIGVGMLNVATVRNVRI